MRLNAYLLLGDPRWIRQSVLSYYDHVEQVVALGDRNHLAWNGGPLAVQECIDILTSLDREKKVRVVLRDLVSVAAHPMAMDTDARQAALDMCAEADWVLQVDADEIIPNWTSFASALLAADNARKQALDYPARWFLGRAHSRLGDLHLEASDGMTRIAAHYPGPLAIRPGRRLNYSRRSIADYFRVDFKPWNTYHEYTRSHPVHMVVPRQDGVIHMSWVDPPEGPVTKAASQHGHAREHLMTEFAALRLKRLRHPWRTVLTTPLRASHGHPHRLRLTRLAITADTVRFR